VSHHLFKLITFLTKSRATLLAATAIFTAHEVQDYTCATETKRRHALEKHDKDLATVHALELQLGITMRWVPGSPEWEEAGRLVSMRKYQRSLDNLEGLVVARIFELTKMNRSQTGEPTTAHLLTTSHIILGYALRKHIAKALQNGRLQFAQLSINTIPQPEPFVHHAPL
jgi:hypothetical protein